MKTFINNPHFSELLHKGAISFVIRITGAGLTFLLYIYLARLLGAHDYGLFMLAFTIVNIFAVLARVGMDNVLIRHVARYAQADNYSAVKGYFHVGLLIASVSGLLCSMTLFYGSDWISERLLGKPDLAPTLWNMTWMLIPFSLGLLVGEALKGLKHVGEAAVTQVIILPGVSLILLSFYSVWVASVELKAAVTIYVFSAFCSLTLGVLFWGRALPRVKAVKPRVLEMTRSGLPLLLSSSGMLAMAWADTLVLGIYETSEVVGVYNAASRTAMMTSLILVAFNAIAAPKFSAFFLQRNTKALKELAQQSSFLLMILVLPPTIILIFFGDWVLGFFGDEFSVAEYSLAILVVGQFVNVSCGSVVYLLSMTGNDIAVRNIIVITLMINIVLNILLVNFFGMLGVAIATAFCTILWNVWMLVVIKQRLGFYVLGYIPWRGN